MVKRSFRLVDNLKINNLAKFNKVFIINLIRTFLYLIEKIKIKTYYRTNNIFVDYIINIKKENIQLVLQLLLKSCFFNYNQLTNMTAIDNLKLDTFKLTERFSIVYILTNINTTARLNVIFNTNLDSKIKTIKNIYINSIWLEREIYDLFGIDFYGHENLIRILNDYGFIGHPLQKSFPLTGFVELRYDELTKGVTYRRLIFMQQSRVFTFESPWNQYSFEEIYEKI